MPRYHFNVYDEAPEPDRDGTLLPDLETARIEAIRFAGELLSGHPTRFRQGGQWAIDVTDETGLILFSLLFVATDAPAVGGQG